MALLLFSSVLLGVGIHHLVATGTCSSTGYSGSFGPVPHCPSGTGWWVGFVMFGIFGGLAGSAMAGNGALIFAGIFGAIGIGALTIVFDSTASSGAKLFGAIFGGAFALVGLGALVAVVGPAIRGLGSSLRPQEVRHGKTKTTSRGSPSPSSPSMGMPTPEPAPAGPTPLNLVPGLQAMRTAGSRDAVDELSKLAELHSQGGLTDQEFAAAKAKLLNQM